MQIAITHLTRMGHPHICAAGVDRQWRHWRPVSAPRESGDGWKLDQGWLRSQGGLLEVGAVIDFGDVQPTTGTEDVVVDYQQAKFVKYLYLAHFVRILDRLAQDSLGSIFGPELERLSSTAAAVPEGEGEVSLGVLRLKGAELQVHGDSEIRLMFEDTDFGEMALKVTDLRLWEVYKPRLDRVNRIQAEMGECLAAVGLTGAFVSSSYPGPRHWLQVNNIYLRENPLWARE